MLPKDRTHASSVEKNLELAKAVEAQILAQTDASIAEEIAKAKANAAADAEAQRAADEHRELAAKKSREQQGLMRQKKERLRSGRRQQKLQISGGPLHLPSGSPVGTDLGSSVPFAAAPGTMQSRSVRPTTATRAS